LLPRALVSAFGPVGACSTIGDAGARSEQRQAPPADRSDGDRTRTWRGSRHSA